MDDLSVLFDQNNIEESISISKLLKLGGISSLLDLLKTNESTGLDDKNNEDINSRIKEYGTNKTINYRARSFLSFLLVQFQDFCVQILMIATILLIIVGSLSGKMLDTIFQAVSLTAAILTVILVGSLSDFHKERQFKKLYSKGDQPRINVIRNSETKTIFQNDLLVGDIIEINSGDYLTIDVIIIKSTFIEVDESQVTGVSVSKAKSCNIDPFIISGSSILEGSCLAVVCCVGEKSVIGNMRKKIGDLNKINPILNDNSRIIVRIMISIGLLSALIMFLILTSQFLVRLKEENKFDVWTKQNSVTLLEILLSSLVILILSVPEGLPLIITLSLAFSLNKLRKINVIARKLSNCYIMGGCNILCFDKTGTLSFSNLIVSKLYSNQQIIDILDIKFLEIEKIPLDLKFNIFITTVIGNSKSYNLIDFFEKKENYIFKGSRTDIGLIQFLNDSYDNKNIIVDPTKIIKVISFSSNGKFKSIFYQINDYQIDVFIKGNPEFLLENSKFMIYNNKYIDLNTEKKQEISHILDNFGVYSLRSIGFARKTCIFDQKITDLNEIIIKIEKEILIDLVFEAALAFQDQIRHEALSTLNKLKNTGIEIKILSGDNLKSTYNFAQQMGIIPSNLEFNSATNQEIIFSGKDYNSKISKIKAEKKESEGISSNLLVMGRATSENKALLVKSLIDEGNIVGYVGDGNNDAEAMRVADIGFVMNITGTETCKQCASAILMDDNLEKLVNAVIWGRNIYENLHRFIYFQFTFFIVSIIILILSSAFYDDEPLSIIQIIWLSLIHDVFSSIALSTEMPSDQILDSKPFKRKNSFITKYLIKLIFTQVIYQVISLCIILFVGNIIFNIKHSSLLYELNEDITWDEDLATHYTIFFHITALMQIFNLFNARRIRSNEYNVFDGITKNKNLIIIQLTIFVIQFLMVHFCGEYCQCSRLSWMQHFYCLIWGSGSTLFFILSKFILEEKKKTFKKRFSRNFEKYNFERSIEFISEEKTEESKKLLNEKIMC